MKTIINTQAEFNELAKTIKDFTNFIYTGEKLMCQEMEIVKLPELPNCKDLRCEGNELTKLPELPMCVHLECWNNKLITLPELPNVLLGCWDENVKRTI